MLKIERKTVQKLRSFHRSEKTTKNVEKAASLRPTLIAVELLPLSDATTGRRPSKSTLGLFDSGRHRGEEVQRRHERFVAVVVVMRHVNRREIAENLVGSRVLANAVLILNNLP